VRACVVRAWCVRGACVRANQCAAECVAYAYVFVVRFRFLSRACARARLRGLFVLPPRKDGGFVAGHSRTRTRETGQQQVTLVKQPAGGRAIRPFLPPRRRRPPPSPSWPDRLLRAFAHFHSRDDHSSAVFSSLALKSKVGSPSTRRNASRAGEEEEEANPFDAHRRSRSRGSEDSVKIITRKRSRFNRSEKLPPDGGKLSSMKARERRGTREE